VARALLPQFFGQAAGSEVDHGFDVHLLFLFFGYVRLARCQQTRNASYISALPSM
jgi:hypothetical protein